MQVTIFEASRRLAQLIRSVQTGNEVVIADGNTPVTRLLPVESAALDTAGRANAVLDWLAKHPVQPNSRRSAQEIDDAITAKRAAWD